MIIIAILIIAVLGLSGFIIYDKVISKYDDNQDKTSNVENSDSDNNSNTSSSKVEEISINDNLIQKLTEPFSNLFDGKDSGLFLLPQDINNNKLYFILISLYYDDKFITVGEDSNHSLTPCDQCLTIDDAQYEKYIDQSVVRDKFKNVFGPDEKYADSTLGKGWSMVYFDLSEQKYWSEYSFMNPGRTIYYFKLNKAEKQEDIIRTYWTFYNEDEEFGKSQETTVIITYKKYSDGNYYFDNAKEQ